MKRERAREFLFEPSRYKNDPAVMRMSLEARGAFSILFCEGWDMPEPGVIPDDDNLLAILARTDIESWLEVRNEVATAYDTTSRPGFWIQRGTVTTYESQRQWFATQAEHGRLGGLKRASRLAKGRLKRPDGGMVRLGEDGKGKVLTEKRSEKDSVPLTERDGAGDPARVPLAAGSFANAPGEPRTSHPDARAQIEALRQAGLVPAKEVYRRRRP